MVQVIMKPEIFKYATCKEFAEGFALGAEDLVLTNKFIFEPYFGPLGLKVHTIFQEEYGMGEPTDVMCESIMQDAAKTGCKRIIAIGGGTVIDIAKALAAGGNVVMLGSLLAGCEDSGNKELERMQGYWVHVRGHPAFTLTETDGRYTVIRKANVRGRVLETTYPVTERNGCLFIETGFSIQFTYDKRNDRITLLPGGEYRRVTNPKNKK